MIPRGLHGAIKVVENWTFSLFFCSAELWGSVVIAVLFWTLANDVCTVDEAKTVYPMMGIAANVALVAAGNYMKFVSATVLKGATTQVFLQTMVTTIVGTSIAMALVRPLSLRSACCTNVRPACSQLDRCLRRGCV